MKLKRRYFLASASYWIVKPTANAKESKTTDAGPIIPPVHKINDFDLEIVDPGKYKLIENIVVRESLLSFMGHGWPKGGPLISLFSGGVELDLNSHLIRIHHGMSAISLSESSNRELANKWGSRVGSADGRFVILKNGEIDLFDDDRGNNGIELLDAWTHPGAMRGEQGNDTKSGLRAPKAVAYVKNEYLLEKIKVLSRGVSIAVEGGYNVVRNCIIESAGNAAIFAAGPNVLIENCDIRLHPLVEGQDHYDTPLRAAIVLRDGTNAVIRNNRIRVDKGGLPSDTHCILIRDGATNVLIENNTFINVEGETVTAMEGSQIASRGNVTENRTRPW